MDISALKIKDATGTAVASVEARKQTPTGNALNVQIGPGDTISNVPVIMDFEHHQVHEGETFLAQDKQAALGSGTVKYSIVVPTYANTIQAPHMVIVCDVYNGNTTVDIYETATFTGGSALTNRNRNRNIADDSTVVIKTGVTSADGTLIKSFYAGAGKSTSGSSRTESEMVLKSNTTYRVDIIGRSAGTEAIVGFMYYLDLGV